MLLALTAKQLSVEACEYLSVLLCRDSRHAADPWTIRRDTNIYVWSVSKPSKNISIKNAHAGGVNSVCWIDEKRIASAGSDACVRLYDIKRHA